MSRQKKIRMTIAACVSRFLISLEAQAKAPRTTGSYKERLRYLSDFLEDTSVTYIDEVTQEHVDDYIVGLRRCKSRYHTHPSRPDIDGGLSPATLAGRIQAMKALFAWCVRRGHLLASPAAHIRKERVDQNAANRAMKPEDLQAMVDYAQNKGMQRDYAMLLLFADTGCRVGELCSLNLDKIDLRKGEARVTGKTGPRIVYFTPSTAQALGDYLHIRPSVQTRSVFVTRRKKRMSRAALHSQFRRIAAQVDVKKYNPHAIRHRVGQGWIDKGANLELIRQKLGHRDITTTSKFYANQDQERIRQASTQFSLVADLCAG